MIFSRTRSVFSKLLDDIKKTSRVVTIGVQVVFFIIYGVQIYSNRHNLIFLIAYSVLFLLAILGFAFYLSTLKKEKKKNLKYSKRTVRISKYFVNSLMIILNIVNILKNGSTDLQIIIEAVAVFALLFNIIVEIIRIFIERYVDLFTTSFEMDIEPLTKIADVKGNFISVIDAIPEMIANKIEGKEKELTKTQLFIEKLNANYTKDCEKEKQIKKQEQAEKNKERQAKERDELKRHFQVIADAVAKKMPTFKKGTNTMKDNTDTVTTDNSNIQNNDDKENKEDK